MGRHKSTISDPEQATEELVSQACAIFKMPYDDRVDRDTSFPTLRFVADTLNTTILRVRKLLITGNYFSTNTSRTVREMMKQGKTVEQIMEAVGLGKASVYSYLPYKNIAFNLSVGQRSSNADRHRIFRSRQKALSVLKECPSSLNLWHAIVLFQGCKFSTSGRGSREGVQFKYSVSAGSGKGGKQYAGEWVDGYGNEIFIFGHEKSITRSSVDYALKIAIAGKVTGPKQLKIFGASYVFAIFKRFGLL